MPGVLHPQPRAAPGSGSQSASNHPVTSESGLLPTAPSLPNQGLLPAATNGCPQVRLRTPILYVGELLEEM